MPLKTSVVPVKLFEAARVKVTVPICASLPLPLMAAAKLTVRMSGSLGHRPRSKVLAVGNVTIKAQSTMSCQAKIAVARGHCAHQFPQNRRHQPLRHDGRNLIEVKPDRV